MPDRNFPLDSSGCGNGVEWKEDPDGIPETREISRS